MLGPFYFLLYIASLLPIHNSTHCVKYADDSTFMCPIFKNDIHASISVVKSEIDNAITWSTRHKLSLNSSKTNIIVFNKHMYNATPIDYCTCDASVSVSVSDACVSALTLTLTVRDIISVFSAANFHSIFKFFSAYLSTYYWVFINCVRSRAPNPIATSAAVYQYLKKQNKLLLNLLNYKFYSWICSVICSAV